ncbi:MAG TPA: DsrE family protein [Bacteroidia bacterium]|nr:DsrE family protein [Bacteroidota bacterium]HRC33335.1 DsrE family protein [Bacteroidia bacterium]
MKKILLLVMAFAFANTITAQTKTNNNKHKIVFQLASDDTLVHKALMKQLNNIVTVAPETKIEVVVQGGGLTMLMINKTIVQEKIAQLKKKNVEFVACEFSMTDKKITKEMMIPEAGFVPYGILEIVTKQEEGWSYIKSGF